MSMFPIVRFVVAALLLTSSSVALVPKVNNTTATTPTTIVTTASASTQLSAEEATAIALAHAGLTQEEVTGLNTRQEKDDGILHWDIEFRCDAYAHDYEIHAETGAILDHDRDRLRPQKQPQTPPVEETPVTPPEVTEPVVTELTQEEALALALAHAGLTQEEVSQLRIKKDHDDGIWIYEIEFRASQMEYEYEIHAETGAILEWDKEFDD